MQLFDGQRHRRHLLHELGADLLGNSASARSSQEHARVLAVDPNLGFDSFQEFQRLLRLFGFMPLIVLPQNLVISRVYDDCFYRG